MGPDDRDLGGSSFILGVSVPIPSLNISVCVDVAGLFIL